MVVIETESYKLVKQAFWPFSKGNPNRPPAPISPPAQSEGRPMEQILQEISEAMKMCNHYRVGPGAGTPDAHRQLAYWEQRHVQLNQERIKQQSAKLQRLFPGRDEFHAKQPQNYYPTKKPTISR